MFGSDFGWMYTDALFNLDAGHVDDITRNILSAAPLPAEYTDPFASEDTDPRGVLEMTAKAMTTWVEEARKADYFSKHFVQLSKMIMSGAVTMARGLVSLHNRGEDLSQAPMSIGDLISLGSYQFRKSYLGVLQTAKTYPEISRRLLMNQLGWANTLLRLFKTKERLETPAAVKPAASELGSGEGNALDAAPRNTLRDKTPKALKAPKGEAYSDIASIFEPGSYNAPRAFSSLDGTPAPRAAKRTAGEISGKAETPETGSERAEKTPETKQQETAPQAGTGEAKSAEMSGSRQEAPEADEAVRTDETPETIPESSGENEKEDPENKENGGAEGSGMEPPEEGLPGPEPVPPPGEDPADAADPPEWFLILSRAYNREPPEGREDTVTFTEDEVLLLVDDPEFRALFPDIADSLRDTADRIRSERYPGMDPGG